MGTSEKGDYATVKAYVNFVKHTDTDPWYTSCTNAGCNKKVIEAGSNWMCEKCNKSNEDVKNTDFLIIAVFDSFFLFICIILFAFYISIFISFPLI